MKIYGIDVYYIPRSVKNLDTIMNEDIASEFGAAYMIEMYLDDVDGYAGEQTIMSKFGLEIRDSATWTVSKRRWEQFIGQHKDTFVKGRPNEGDLIWIPITGSFHEIKFVEHEQPFYQLGNIFTYKLQTETFEFSNERFNTGNEVIDSIEDTYQYAQRVLVTLNPSTVFSTEEAVQQLIGYDEANEPIYMYAEIGDSYYKAPDDKSQMWLVLNNIRSSDGELKYFIESDVNVIEGLSSGASAIITQAESAMEITNDPDADNINFERQADEILDFSETNPFGEPGNIL